MMHRIVCNCLTMEDGFDGTQINLDRWSLHPPHPLLSLGWPTQQYGRLEHPFNGTDSWVLTEDNQIRLSGDFEVRSDFSLIQLNPGTDVHLSLVANCQNNNFGLIELWALYPSGGSVQYKMQAWFNDPAVPSWRAEHSIAAFTTISPGTLRLARQGTTWTFSYWSNSVSNFVTLLTLNEAAVGGGAFGECDLHLQNYSFDTDAYYTYVEAVQVLKNRGISYSTGQTVYAPDGVWQAEVDGGTANQMVWQSLKWDSGSKPSGTGAVFKVRGCTGSGGSGCTSWQTSPQISPGGVFNLDGSGVGHHRYLQVRVEISSDSNHDASPVITGLRLDYETDTGDPVISIPQVSNPLISPQNGDSVLDSTTLSATISDLTPTDWTMTIAKGGTTYRIFSGSGSNISQFWDGKDDSGSFVPDGDYDVTVVATDQTGHSANQTATALVKVDNTAPDKPRSTGDRPGLPDYQQWSASICL